MYINFINLFHNIFVIVVSIIKVLILSYCLYTSVSSPGFDVV